jgi:hypothetical protein
MRVVKLFASLLVVLLTCLSAQARDPSIPEYFIGRDLRATIPSGTYSGLANPNFNRLTFLYAHTYTDTPSNNHYHSKSTYTYFGPNLGAGTAVQPFNGTATGEPRNYLPEGAFGNSPRLQLLPGSGVFSGKLISGLTPGVDFADLQMRSVDWLAGEPSGSPKAILFNSGGSTPPGRWTGSMAGSILSLVLVGKSPDTFVADQLGATILSNVGDSYLLGSGGASPDFTPVFFTTDPTPRDLFLEFKLVDSGTGNAGGPWMESGVFRFNLVVPEPASLGLLGPVVFGLLRRRRGTRSH